MSANTSDEPLEPSAVEASLPVDHAADGLPSNEKLQWADWSEWPSWRDPGFAENNAPTMLLEPMLDLDSNQCAVWKEEVQNLLILAGLFSAVVTAFVVESYQMLQPDPNDQIIALLSHIADQANTTIGNVSAFPATSSTFVPSSSNVRVNIYWFISLVLSLTVALIGIVAQQWLREHQLYKKDMNSRLKFAIFNARSDGLKQWYVPQVFAGLPLLLQAALVLFFIGLVEFLFSIQIDVAIPVFAAVAVPIVFLVVTTMLPTLQLCTMHFPYFLRVNDRPPAPCPYKSPQALIFQNAIIASNSIFNLFAVAFAALWIPFVTFIRLFVSSIRPFYGKGAPFYTDDSNYLCSRNRLRNAGRKWMKNDRQWLATRTSYAVAIQAPITPHQPQDPHISNINITEVIGFYDWTTGIKKAASSIGPTDFERRTTLDRCIHNSLATLCMQTWADEIQASHTDPAVATRLQARFAVFLRIISLRGYQQTENLVELSDGNHSVLLLAIYAVFIDQALGSELDFSHHFVHTRLATHMRLTRLYLLHNAHTLFLCSNLPGITPSFSLSTGPSLAYHRRILEGNNKPWMNYTSGLWSWTLRQVILDVCEIAPSQPFTHKCTGSSISRCGSNLHTESIVELTEYILLFQVPDDIQETLRVLHELCTSKPNPVKERPFVLITACAYINAVANVNQDDVDGFSTLLRTICELCSSLKPTLEARPGGMGRYWPSLEVAFDYIRNHACNQPVSSATAVPPAPELLHDVGASDRV